MNNAHRKTLAAIFAVPTRNNIAFRQAASLLRGVGCREQTGSGSRVRFVRDGDIFTMH